MCHKLINLSPDLKQLRDEGYDLEIRENHLIIRDIPYVTTSKEIKRGEIVSVLNISGDIASYNNDHVAHFSGEYPCDFNGVPIEKIRHVSQKIVLAQGVTIQHSFSSKPREGYKNYYEKMTTYINIISSQAEKIDPNVTPRTFPVIELTEEESVFCYLDTATSRAGITLATHKLEQNKIAIIGLGGSGSYILDLIVKTPVKEIYLFDGDKISNHNAFRSPGAISKEDLNLKPKKVDYYKNVYSRMHRNIIANDIFINDENITLLMDMDFVFLCIDRGDCRRLIMEKLCEWNIMFIDVGMGIELVEDSLVGILRISSSTKRDHNFHRLLNRIPTFGSDGDYDYSSNIQVSDLNALNAALAVIRWKKLLGFYQDREYEHFSAYTIDGNSLINEDQYEPSIDINS